MAVFDLFSKRDQPMPEVFQTDTLPKEFRVQVQWIWKSSLMTLGHWFGGRYENDYMKGIRDLICRRTGKVFLHRDRTSPENDLMGALTEGSDTKLGLDIIETSFRVMLTQVAQGRLESRQIRTYIAELNHNFREHGIGYQFDCSTQRLIPINAPLIDEQAVRPALALLLHADFATANKEFMEAWDDFKKSDFDDCLTKCCSCFESVMKIICTKKGWAFDPKDTAGPLIKNIVTSTGMDSFFEQPLLLIATMRNRLSSSHGAGTTPKNPPEHIARYALNATASAILLLVEAAGV
jgi:hypothetical protein